MSALATRNDSATFTTEQRDLIRRTVASGVSEDEFNLFLEVCRASGLNPFQRQIHAVMRVANERDEMGNWTKRQRMVIQTGIDGYRLIASRTGEHVGTTEPEFGPSIEAGPLKDCPEWCRVVVKRWNRVAGVVAEFPAVAHFSEYAQQVDEYEDKKKTGRKRLNAMWARMPRVMIAKCAEAIALRKAFPAELASVYVPEEVQQMGEIVAQPAVTAPAPALPARASTPDVQAAAGELADKIDLAQTEIELRALSAEIKALPEPHMSQLKKAYMTRYKELVTPKPEREPGEEG